MTLRDYRKRARDRFDDHEATRDAIWAFRESCIGAGIAQSIDGAIAGSSWRTPEVTSVRLGPPLQLTVRMCPGQVPGHLAKVGRFVAPHLGGRSLRVADRGHGWCVVTVLNDDPLADPLALELWRPGVLIGRSEDGEPVDVDHPRELPHVIAQGQTRSGKSSFLYSLITQTVRERDCLVAGVDPSGITLRPLIGTRHDRWLASGLSDVGRIVEVLAGLVAEMDSRLVAMPRDRDILPTGPDMPLVLVVLEEYPALLRALDPLKTRDGDPGKAVRASVARLLAESHKVGFRVVIAAQRAEATIVGAAERAQCAGRLTFRVDSTDTIKLLHVEGAELAGEHTVADPGIALLSWPGLPLTRIRAPYIGGYRDYVAAIDRAEPGAAA